MIALLTLMLARVVRPAEQDAARDAEESTHDGVR